MKSIGFNIDDSVFLHIRNKRLLKAWIVEVLQEYHIDQFCLSYLFCSEEKILVINQEYLQHNYYTDIITFDLSEEKNVIVSDLYISVETVLSNSIKYKTSFDLEMCRVVIHGLLHLLGFGDKNKKQIKTIRDLETQHLKKLFHVKQPFFTQKRFHVKHNDK